MRLFTDDVPAQTVSGEELHRVEGEADAGVQTDLLRGGSDGKSTVQGLRQNAVRIISR